MCVWAGVGVLVLEGARMSLESTMTQHVFFWTYFKYFKRKNRSDRTCTSWPETQSSPFTGVLRCLPLKILPSGTIPQRTLWDPPPAPSKFTYAGIQERRPEYWNLVSPSREKEIVPQSLPATSLHLLQLAGNTGNAWLGPRRGMDAISLVFLGACLQHQPLNKAEGACVRRS